MGHQIITIRVMSKTLSDGSKVFDVSVPPTKLAAKSEDDAWDLAGKIRDAIRSHSLDHADVAE